MNVQLRVTVFDVDILIKVSEVTLIIRGSSKTYKSKVENYALSLHFSSLK